MFFPAETQSRRDKRRENQEEAERTEPGANLASGIRLCLVHPSATRTSSPSCPPLSSSLVFASQRLSLRHCVSAGNASLCLLPSPPPNNKSSRRSYYSKPGRKGQCPARCRRPNFKGFQKRFC